MKWTPRTLGQWTHNGLRVEVVSVDGLYVRVRYVVSGVLGTVRFNTLTFQS